MIRFSRERIGSDSSRAQATCMKLILAMRPSLRLVVEQPSGSWGYKQTFMVALAAMFNMLHGLDKVILVFVCKEPEVFFL